ncbi:hypothetical protein ACSSZE_05925 [Acidithiobacillus caldus]
MQSVAQESSAGSSLALVLPENQSLASFMVCKTFSVNAIINNILQSWLAVFGIILNTQAIEQNSVAQEPSAGSSLALVLPETPSLSALCFTTTIAISKIRNNMLKPWLTMHDITWDAQAIAYESVGREFESLRAHQKKQALSEAS